MEDKKFNAMLPAFIDYKCTHLFYEGEMADELIKVIEADLEALHYIMSWERTDKNNVSAFYTVSPYDIYDRFLAMLKKSKCYIRSVDAIYMTTIIDGLIATYDNSLTSRYLLEKRNIDYSNTLGEEELYYLRNGYHYPQFISYLRKIKAENKPKKRRKRYYRK